MRDDIPAVTYQCSCCGGRITDEWAEQQYEDAHRTEGTLCDDCAEDSLIMRYRRAFPEIRETLDPDQRETWDDAAAWQKAAFAMKLEKSGQLDVGEIEATP